MIATSTRRSVSILGHAEMTGASFVQKPGARPSSGPAPGVGCPAARLARVIMPASSPASAASLPARQRRARAHIESASPYLRRARESLVFFAVFLVSVGAGIGGAVLGLGGGT